MAHEGNDRPPSVHRALAGLSLAREINGVSLSLIDFYVPVRTTDDASQLLDTRFFSLVL